MGRLIISQRGLLARREARGWVGGGAAFLDGKGVQSISRKSVCTARSPNAATLSSYSFDHNPRRSEHTQSLMAAFKDRHVSIQITTEIFTFNGFRSGLHEGPTAGYEPTKRGIPSHASSENTVFFRPSYGAVEAFTGGFNVET